MTAQTPHDLDLVLAETAAEYDDEDRAAAAEEGHEKARSTVFSVRLSAHLYDAVRVAADRAHLTPSALIRQWVSERAESTDDDDLANAVAALRRDVDRLAKITPQT